MIFTTDKKKLRGGVTNEYGILLILNMKLEIGLRINKLKNVR
jgi:hypothetical protein